MSEETKKPEKNVPRALLTMIVIVLVLFAGISLVSLSVMPAEELATEWARDPVAGIAFYIPIDVLRAILKPLIAVLAGTILLIATNAGIIGISRLVFSQGTRGLVPPVLSRIHKKYKTPYVSIIVFSIIAVLLLLPGFTAIDIFKSLGALYAIGSLLSFMFAHASIIALRMTKPDLPRPFRLGWNIRVKGKDLPITALIGFLAVTAIWVILLIDQVYSRWVGLAWMGIGLIIYWILLWRQHRKQKQWVTEPEKE
jgi:APA family basic amino acid/polyamine antiporter